MILNNKHKKDYDLMIGSAVRYALGRQTYMVGVTCDYVINDIQNDDCTLRELVVMARDIIEHKDYCNRFEIKQPYGANCDLEDWKRLYKVISDKIKELDKDTWDRERFGEFNFED